MISGHTHPVCMHVVLRGKRWGFRFVDRLPDGANGEMDPASKRTKEIRIALDQGPEELLDTAIHECLHACLPDLNELSVEETATDIARVLTRLGVRVDTRSLRSQLKGGGE